MNKEDLKKLALLGLAGGVMMSTTLDAAKSRSVQSNPRFNNQIAQGGCAGPGGCPGTNGNGANKTNGTNANGTNGNGANKTNGTNANGTNGNGANKINGTNGTNANGTNGTNVNGTNGKMQNNGFAALLSPEGKKLYDSMDGEGKALAQRLANQTCKGHNECKGLNACKTEKNSCAGQGACKGQGKCSFKDKNQAVKVAYDHMKAKRANMNNSMQNQRRPVNQGNYRY